MPEQSTLFKPSHGILNSVYSLLALFIAFTILAVIASGYLPSLRSVISLPINELPLVYTYTDIRTLFADSFAFSLNRIGLAIVFILCAFSLFGKAVISVITAFCGFCLGSALFCTLSSDAVERNLSIYLAFTVIAYLLSVLFASVCLQANKMLFISPAKNVARITLVLFMLLLTFCGAHCLLKTIELLLL